MDTDFNDLWNDPNFITDEEKARIDSRVALVGKIKPHIISSQNSSELAQRIKEASTQILKSNYQLYKDLGEK